MNQKLFFLITPTGENPTNHTKKKSEAVVQAEFSGMKEGARPQAELRP